MRPSSTSSGRPKTVAVFGGRGYLGRPLVRRLRADGYAVRSYDAGLFESSYGSDEEPWTRLDTRDVDASHLVDVDEVVHLAELSNDPLGELNPSLTRAINVWATLSLAKTCRAAGVRRFIYLSSASVYGAASTLSSVVDERSTVAPLTTYAECKATSEVNLLGLSGSDFSVTVLRLATVYGRSSALRADLVINDLALQGIREGQIRLTSDGTAWRPFVHVEDVCNVLSRLITMPAEALASLTVNVGTTLDVRTTLDVAHVVARELDVPVSVLGNTVDRRSYRLRFDRLTELGLSDALVWTVERGVQDLVEFLRDSNQRELLLSEIGRLRRLETLKYLLTIGQLTEELRWVE